MLPCCQPLHSCDSQDDMAWKHQGCFTHTWWRGKCHCKCVLQFLHFLRISSYSMWVFYVHSLHLHNNTDLCLGFMWTTPWKEYPCWMFFFTLSWYVFVNKLTLVLCCICNCISFWTHILTGTPFIMIGHWKLLHAHLEALWLLLVLGESR